jgi:hypothetical protein
MTWLRIEDDLLDHDKWRRALRLGGDAVLATWWRLSSWCARRLTDGIVPADMVEEIAELEGSKTRAKALRALAEARLIEWRGDGTLALVNWLDRNPSRAEVLADRDRRAQSQRIRRDARGVTGHAPERVPRHVGARPPSVTPSHPIPSHPLDPLLLPRAHEPPEAGPPEPPDPTERVIEPVDDGWGEPEPGGVAEAQGERTVWRTLEGFLPSEELYAEAAMQGVSREVFDRQLKKLKNGPIGGARGVFDREDYVRDQIPKWRTWDETERAKARAAPTGGFRGPTVPTAIEPTAKHRAYAKRYGLDLDRIADELAKQGAVEALGAKGALDALGSALTAAVRAAKGAAA